MYGLKLVSCRLCVCLCTCACVCTLTRARSCRFALARGSFVLGPFCLMAKSSLSNFPRFSSSIRIFIFIFIKSELPFQHQPHRIASIEHHFLLRIFFSLSLNFTTFKWYQALWSVRQLFNTHDSLFHAAVILALFQWCQRPYFNLASALNWKCFKFLTNKTHRNNMNLFESATVPHYFDLTYKNSTYFSSMHCAFWMIGRKILNIEMIRKFATAAIKCE